MEETKKKLYRTGSFSMMPGLILLIIAVVLFAVGTVMAVMGTHYKPFNPNKGGYVTIEGLFVEGPFAEQTNDKGRNEKQFWIIYDKDFNEYILQTAGNYSALPIFGEDFFEEEIDNLSPISLKGKSVKIPKELLPFLLDFYTDFGMTEDNYQEFVGGTYMFDATQKSSSAGMVFFVLSFAVGLAALLTMIILAVKNSSLKRKFNDPAADLQLQRVYQDFAAHPDAIYARKLRVAVSPSFLVDFNAGKEGFRLIPLEGIMNAFQCNMVDGNPTTYSYIAVENASGRYLFAESIKVSTAFNQIIAYLKKIIAGGQTWS